MNKLKIIYSSVLAVLIVWLCGAVTTLAVNISYKINNTGNPYVRYDKYNLNTGYSGDIYTVIFPQSYNWLIWQ